MAHSIFDLAFTYIQRFYPEEPSTEEKKTILNQFGDLLGYGWTTEEIVKGLKAFITKYPDERPDIPRLFSKLNTSKGNLIAPTAFYYHNQLRVMSGPPKRELDYNTGEITKVEEDFFLEMRASYTIDDLVDYFANQFKLNVSPHDRQRYIGGFKFLLRQYNIDIVLFMIDAAANLTYSEDMNNRDFNPIKLADYRTYAEEQYNHKRTETKLSGDDKIVPRKRVLTFGSSDPIQ